MNESDRRRRRILAALIVSALAIAAMTAVTAIYLFDLI